jgi:hypothetical protein
VPSTLTIPCGCCGGCKNCRELDLDDLLDIGVPGGGYEECGDWDAEPPEPEFRRAPACLRWLCRCVKSDGTVRCQFSHGGPTVNNLSLATLVDECMSPPQKAGCYLYTIEFFGWKRKKKKNERGWISADDAYKIYVTQL